MPQRSPLSGSASSTCTAGAGGAPQPYRIAHVHVPKAAGVALGKMMSAARWPMCGFGDATEAVCKCTANNQSCSHEANVLVGETSHVMLRDLVVRPRAWPSECTVWFALMREPRSWFYSAAREWCSGFTLGFHRRVAACSDVATVDILRESNWFVPLNHSQPFRLHFGKRDLRSRDVTGQTAYWFRHANLQTTMVSSMFSEPNWMICDISRLEEIANAMSRLRQPDLAALKPQFAHSMNTKRGTVWGEWLQKWAARVPWESVSHMYELDVLLHAKLAAAPSKCIWNLRPELQHIAPRDR